MPCVNLTRPESNRAQILRILHLSKGIYCGDDENMFPVIVKPHVHVSCKIIHIYCKSKCHDRINVGERKLRRCKLIKVFYTKLFNEI